MLKRSDRYQKIMTFLHLPNAVEKGIMRANFFRTWEQHPHFACNCAGECNPGGAFASPDLSVFSV